MFSNASNFTRDVDMSFAVIIGISLFFLVGLTALMIYFVFKYNHKRNKVASDIHGNVKLEILWTVIPTILVLVMFYYGWDGYSKMRTAPDDAIVIKTTGRMWSWSFEYPNGKVSDTLVVPIDKAVKLDLISEDVIHSLYIPAFRIKEDLVPGDTNWMWFIGQELGKYHILCAEYCGDRHSYMISSVDVVKEDFYNKWVNDTAKAQLAGPEAGMALLKQNACLSCHSVDGSQLVGPSFKGLLGKTQKVATDAGEKTITVDAEYIKRAVEDPNFEAPVGFSKIMPQNYKGKFSEKDYEQIMEYLKSIK